MLSAIGFMSLLGGIDQIMLTDSHKQAYKYAENGKTTIFQTARNNFSHKCDDRTCNCGKILT